MATLMDLATSMPQGASQPHALCCSVLCGALTFSFGDAVHVANIIGLVQPGPGFVLSARV